MALDTGLAAWQVRRHVRVSLAAGSIGYVIAVVTVVVAVPSLLVALLWGQGSLQLVVAVVVSGLAMLGYCAVDRRRLHLDQLRSIRRDRPAVR